MNIGQGRGDLRCADTTGRRKTTSSSMNIGQGRGDLRCARHQGAPKNDLHLDGHDRYVGVRLIPNLMFVTDKYLGVSGKRRESRPRREVGLGPGYR